MVRRIGHVVNTKKLRKISSIQSETFWEEVRCKVMDSYQLSQDESTVTWQIS